MKTELNLTETHFYVLKYLATYPGARALSHPKITILTTAQGDTEKVAYAVVQDLLDFALVQQYAHEDEDAYAASKITPLGRQVLAQYESGDLEATHEN